MNKINALVIDDEFANRDLIAQLIVKINENFNILGTAESADVAYTLINEIKPDLIFLDIKMPGGSGFDLLKKFKNPEFEVVFITGFDEYAIQAFEFNALDYVLKPIDTTKLGATLDKVHYRITNKLSVPKNLLQIVSGYDAANSTIAKIPIHYMDKVILLDIKEIISIQSDEGYTTFTMQNSEQYISSKQLATFEFIIDPHKQFIRINKGAYINLNYLKSYSKGQICIVEMVNGMSFEVSRRRKSEILGILDK